MKLNKLESKFFGEVLRAELGVPVRATLVYQGNTFNLIVVSEIGASGYFTLKYYNAPAYDPEPQSNDDGITTKTWSGNARFGTHPLLEKAWQNRDLVTVQLFPSELPFQHQDSPRLKTRLLFANWHHRGSLVLDRNQVTVRESPITTTEFSLAGFPDFVRSRTPTCIVLSTDDGWNIAVTKENIQTRGSVGHTGVITRSDEGEYTADELDGVLQGLKYFFGFVAGVYVHPTIVIGYDLAKQPVWGAIGRFDQEQPRTPNWFNHSGAVSDGAYLQALFPMFWSKWKKKQSEVIAVIERYLNSNAMVRAGILRDAVATSYAGLEILASMVLRKTITQHSHKYIDQMLSCYEIPHLLLKPSDTPELASLCEHLGVDERRGCQLLGDVRNYVSHPLDREKPAEIKDHHVAALEGDAMKSIYYLYLHDLCQFYLEHAFLKFCGYETGDFRQLQESKRRSGL